MARKPRIEFEGAFYHVIARGNQRQKIFKDEEDFKKYLNLLTFYKERYKYHLYAYVLMNNHVHLLIETREIPLSKIIQGRLLQKSEKGPFCHSELVEELRQIKQLEHPSTGSG
jgi:REP element-mobilizing transposase RayT